jgi:NitT/TauT family transport system permease protein
MIAKREQSTSPWLGKWALRGYSLALVLIGWEALARLRGGLLLPPFSRTVIAWIDIASSGELLRAVVISNQAMVLGFLLSTLVGVPLGLVLGRIPILEKFTDLYLNVLLVTPMSAIMPLLMIAFGIGLSTRVLVVFVFAVVIITVNTRAGMRSIDPALTEMARSFGANEIQLWRKVFLPGSLPAIVAGVRMGLGRSITGMVVVELLLIAVGLGRLTLRYQGNFEADYTFAVILTILAQAVILMNLAQGLEKRLLTWRPE